MRRISLLLLTTLTAACLWSCKETPTEIPADGAVESVAINKSSLTLYVGGSETLTASILPEDAENKDLSWSSSNTDVASVENGKVTAIAVGTTVITATSDENPAIKDECTVTVEEDFAVDGYLLASIPEDGSTIEGETWKIADGSASSQADFLRLRNALQSAGRNISLEFPKLTSFPDSTFFGEEEVSITNLVSVVAPKATTVGKLAFYWCRGLAHIEMESVTEIKDRAFVTAKIEGELNLPQLTEVGAGAFSSSSTITSLNLPALTTVGDRAFRSCKGLTSVTLPEVITIGEDSFSECTGLIEVSFPKAETVGLGAFQICGNLEKADLPVATSIGHSAFGAAFYLTDVNIPSAVEIGESAFYTCTSLQSIDLPNATSLGGSAFYGCVLLTNVNAPKATSMGELTFASCRGMVEISLPSIEKVGGGAFHSCELLEKVDLPKADSLGYDTFYKCFVVNNINLPEARVIERGSFAYCAQLPEMDLPKLEKMNSIVFHSCFALESVNLPSANFVDDGAFYICPALKEANLPEVKTINRIAFYNCYELKTLLLPKVETVGDSIIWGSSNIENVTLATESKLQRVGKAVFDTGTEENPLYTLCDKINLTTNTKNGSKVDGLEWVINDEAGEESHRFGPFKSITDDGVVVVPDILTLANIPTDGTIVPGTTWVITDASATSGDDFANLRAALNSAGRDITVQFPSLTTIPANAFTSTLISAIELPEVTAIEASAFASSSIKNLDAPKATTIGDQAFNRCYNATLSLPAATNIGSNAFNGCSSMVMIIATESTKLTMNAEAFGWVYMPEMTYGSIEVTTGANNGTTVDGKNWKVGDTTFGPFKALTVVGGEGGDGGEGGEGGQVAAELALADVPADGTLITGDTWTITDASAASADDFANLRAALNSAGRDITVVCPNLTAVPASAFTSTLLFAIELPEVITIETSAFASCSVKNLDAPKATTIGDQAFNRCSSLEILSLPNATSIGNTTFGSCSSLDKLTIATESTELTMNSEAFGWVYFPEQAYTFVNLVTGTNNGSTVEGNNWTVSGTTFGPFNSITVVGGEGGQVATELALADVPADGTLITGDTWTITDASAASADDFANLRAALNSAGRDITVVCPNLTAVPASAFTSTLLFAIELPEVITIETSAFASCSVKNLDAPKATTIGDQAFNRCSSLEILSLPNATSIGNTTFGSCSSLDTLTIATESTELTMNSEAFGWVYFPEQAYTFVNLVTGANNGSTVDGNNWTVNGTTFGPFNSITVK